jgi:hypothetical protein
MNAATGTGWYPVGTGPVLSLFGDYTPPGGWHFWMPDDRKGNRHLHRTICGIPWNLQAREPLLDEPPPQRACRACRAARNHEVPGL